MLAVIGPDGPIGVHLPNPKPVPTLEHDVGEAGPGRPEAVGAREPGGRKVAVAGPDEIEAAATGWNCRSRARGLRGLRVAVMLDCELSETDREYRDILQNLADRIAAAGAVVDDGARPEIDLKELHEVYILLLRAATSARQSAETIAEHLVGGGTARAWGPHLITCAWRAGTRWPIANGSAGTRSG